MLQQRLKWTCLGLLSMGILMLFLVLSSAAPPEPSHKGRPLRSYVNQCAGGKASEQMEARSIIQQMDRTAIPYLTYLLEQRDFPMSEPYMRLRGKLPDFLINHLPTLSTNARGIRLASASLLGVFKKEATVAVEKLSEIALTSKDAGLRVNAVGALAAIGPNSEKRDQIMQLLLKAASDPEAGVRSNALQGLMSAKPDQRELESILPFLSQSLDDPQTRENAVWFCAELGPLAAPLWDKLIPALIEESRNIRIGAQTALEKINPDRYVQLKLPTEK